MDTENESGEKVHQDSKRNRREGKGKGKKRQNKRQNDRIRFIVFGGGVFKSNTFSSQNIMK